MIHILDLNFQGLPNTIAAFLIETTDGPVLIETGPYSTFPTLKSKITEIGFNLNEIKHVLLSHIHLDHGGAAWAFAEQGANIFLHPFGAKHLANPEKLMESARRIYKDQMDSLWGEMNNIPDNQLIIVPDNQEIIVGDKCFKALHTPGHAHHHIAWQLDDAIFTGDIGGVKINSGPVVPPCPPPDINLEMWLESIEKILDFNPAKLYLTHFGIVRDAQSHMTALKDMLTDWAQWILEKRRLGIPQEKMTSQFSNYTTNQLRALNVSEENINIYEAANPSWMSVAGLIRYWEKKEK